MAGKALPADVLTTSGSGLDPDITPANANLQIERMAKARGVAPDQIAALVVRHTTSRSLGIFGEPRVNVSNSILSSKRPFRRVRPRRNQPRLRENPRLRSRRLLPPRLRHRRRRQYLRRQLHLSSLRQRPHRNRRRQSIRPRNRRQDRWRASGEWRRLYFPLKFLLLTLAKSPRWRASKPVPNNITPTPRPTRMGA